MAASLAQLVISVAGALLHLGLAALVVWAAPRQWQNRALAAYFGAWAANYVAAIPATAGIGAWWTLNGHAWLWATALVIPPTYLLFAGLALSTPWVRPLRAPWVQRVLVAALVPLVALPFLRPRTFFTWGNGAGGLAVSWDTAGADAFFAIHVVALTYALGAAIDAWRRAAPGTLTRSRAKGYLLAFGALDAGWILIQSSRFAPGLEALEAFVSNAFFIGAVSFIAAVLLLHAMLRYQLFDFELRLKWTIRRGTVAAVFVAAFLVVAELAENLLAESYGWAIGGVAAGLLVFVLAPLQRMAERVADAAMPHVRDTAEYRLVRKREVYRAALEGAVQDGVVTERERDILARLQDQLGLSATEARSIERDVAGAG